MIFLVIIAVVVGILIVMAAFVACLTVVAKVVNGVQAATSQTVAETVTSAMRGIFGGTEPVQVDQPNIYATDEEDKPFFPSWERDPTLPGAVEEIEGIEAGWGPSEPPVESRPLPGDEHL